LARISVPQVPQGAARAQRPAPVAKAAAAIAVARAVGALAVLLLKLRPAQAGHARMRSSRRARKGIGRSGIVNRKVAPIALSTRLISPPWACTSSAAMARPRPLPPEHASGVRRSRRRAGSWPQAAGSNPEPEFPENGLFVPCSLRE